MPKSFWYLSSFSSSSFFLVVDRDGIFSSIKCQKVYSVYLYFLFLFLFSQKKKGIVVFVIVFYSRINNCPKVFGNYLHLSVLF